MSNIISQCLNANCQQQNSSGTRVCIRCGTNLVLDNRYLLEKFIGEGGFGRTFKAIDEKKLNRPCVVKQFLPQQIGSAALAKAIELFQQEAERLDQLGTHPQIPDLLAFFEQEERFYLIQQFIDGQDLLKELKQNGKFSESQIRDLLIQLLPVLEFIHSHKVIHRDIKPENIIRNNQGNLVLIDFGVSKLLSGSILTRMGTIAGTPGYAPPEQMRGMVYPASDLYSLGVTCIRLLTGCLPEEDGSDELFDLMNMQWTWQNKVDISFELRQVLGKLLQEKVGERYQDVNSVLQVINSLAITQVDSLLEQGINEFKIGNYQAAILNFNQVITLQPNNAIAYQYRSNSYFRLGDSNTAIIECSQAINLKLNNAEAYCLRGNIYCDLGNYNAAISDFNQAIKLKPNNFFTYMFRGDAYSELGNYKSAMSDFDQVIKLKSDFSYAYRRRGNLYTMLNDYKAAILEFNKVFNLTLDDTYTYQGRGFAFYQLGNYNAAISDLNQVIKLGSDDHYVYFLRGGAYSSLGDYQAAILDYDQAINLKPNYASAYRARGNNYFRLDDYQTAILDYNQAIKLNRDSADAYYGRGMAYYYLGDKQAAILDFGQVIRIQPDNASAREYLAILYKKIEDSP